MSAMEERPRLKLQPKGSTSGASGGAARSAKSNPFGAARTREEVLASKGIDAKAIDAKLDERTKRAPRLTKQQEEEMEAATTEVKYEEAQSFGRRRRRQAAEGCKLYVGNISFDMTQQDLNGLFGPYGKVTDAFLPTEREAGARGRAAEGCKLFVGNISYDMTQGDLDQIFGPYGQLTDTFLPTERETAARGFAFVTFSSPAEAQAAIAAVDGQDIDGRALRVNLSDGGGGGGGGGGGY
ncbi:RNA binding-protein [Aureococcus anophagefferens]|nr:RNA binding-protein [Aureococcus anophagefferens]